MSHSLRSLTLVAIAAGAFAADSGVPTPAPTPQPITPVVNDAGLKLTFGGQIQARAEYSDARSTNSSAYDVASGTTNQKSDDLDFYLRRVRLITKGSWSGFNFGVTIAADNAGKTSRTDQGVTLYSATVSRDFASNGLTQTIKVGQDNAWYNSAAFSSSVSALMPANRATDQALGSLRGVGVSYKAVGSNFAIGADVQNNQADDSTNPASTQSEGLFYSTRMEFTPSGEWALHPKDFKESFAGKPGKGVMVALEVGYNEHDLVAAQAPSNAWQNTLGIGLESLFHHDAWSALVELRQDKIINAGTERAAPGQAQTNAANFDTVFRNLIVIQGGYAMPCPIVTGAIIEPVARYTFIDLVRDNHIESADFGSSDYAKASGNQYEIGANWYLSGAAVYSNKVSLLYTHWIAEDSGAAASSVKPKADIVRAQYQMLF